MTASRPKVEVIDKTTIRYSWSKPNANFLPALALRPDLFIYSPSKYLKKLHKKYADPDELAALVKDAGSRSWAQLFNRRNNPYKNDNPKMPTLGPWVLKTKPPADRFVFERNPYYFRVDPQGHQLPYIDKVVFFVADGKLIPAKAGAGESMLQAKDIRFADYTFLKEGEKNGGYRVRAVEDRQWLQLRALPQSDHQRSGVAQADARRALPPRLVAGHQPA